ncbi:MAG: hypothetical protein NTW21_35635, partial [Verrucomicrobia bacterium]|nr:hypothetical protein [Verrucomicrobiota bacterium]
MQLRFFKIPAHDAGGFGEELNGFLRGQRILTDRNNNLGCRTVRSSEDSPPQDDHSDPAAIPSAPPGAAWQNENARPVPVVAAEAAANAPGGFGARDFLGGNGTLPLGEPFVPKPLRGLVAAVCDRRWRMHRASLWHRRSQSAATRRSCAG